MQPQSTLAVERHAGIGQAPAICPSFKSTSPKASCPPSSKLIESFSHYFDETNPNTVTFDATILGAADGQRETSSCSSVLAVLDFGNPYYISKDFYGIMDYGGGILDYYHTEQAVENYISGWQSTATCQVLTVVLGTNNSNMCSNNRQSYCYTGSGYQIEQEAAYLNGLYNSYIAVVGGSDIEMDPGYDTYALTSQWLSGYRSGGYSFMYDYGDACQASYCTANGWTTCDIYQAAWGYGYDEPVPEIYVNGQQQDWQNVQNHESSCSPNSGAMQFEGIANESWGSHIKLANGME